MDIEGAVALVTSLRHKGKWKSAKHVATTTWRMDALLPLLDGNEPMQVVAVELYLSKTHPLINEFAGITRVEPEGIWVYDGDGHVDEQLWLEYLIPWHMVLSVVIHQIS